MHVTGFLSLLCSVLLLGAPSGARAQVGNTAAPFLGVHPSPRVHALGEATVALQGYGGAAEINPAAIGEEGVVRIGTNVGRDQGAIVASDWLPNVFPGASVSVASVSYRRDRWAGALHHKRFTIRGLEVRDERGLSVGTGTSKEWATTVAGAYDVTPAVTFGAAVRLIRSQLGPTADETGILKRSTRTPALGLGVRYDRGFEGESFHVRPQLGWSLSDFGPNVDYDVDAPGDRALPMMMRLGGGVEVRTVATWQHRPVATVGVYGDFSNRLSHTETVCRAVSGGGEQCHVEADGPFRTLFVSGWKAAEGAQLASGRVERLTVWEQTVKHAGLEIEMADLISVRLGRFHEHEANGARQYTSYGIGLDLYYLALQHSWTDRRDHYFWRLTGRIPLDADDPRNFWPEILE